MARITEYHTEAVIEAPPARVWEVLTDLRRYREWNPLVRWVEGDLREGGALRMHIVPLGRSFTVELDVLVEEEEIRWIGSLIGSWFLEGEHYYRLRPETPSRTRLAHGERFRGLASVLIPGFLLRRMESAFVAHNEALKARVEGA